MENESDLSRLVKRLEKVERQNRIFKIAGLTVLLLAGSLFLMGARSMDVIQGEKFVLVDSTGQTLATLGTDNSGRPGLSIKDKATGKERLWLGMWGTGEAGLGFFDKNEKERTRFGITSEDISRLGFYDAADNQKAYFGITSGGQPAMSLWANDLKQRAWIGLTDRDRPGIAVDGSNGKTLVWLGAYSNGVPGVTVYDASEKDRAFIGLNSQGESGVSVRDKNGTERVWLGMFEAGSGNGAGFSALDSSGVMRAFYGIAGGGNVPRGVIYNASKQETWSTPSQ